MLVLSRKKNQTVVIDGQIEVEVLKVKGNTVRLGISAPSNVKVLRGELAPFSIDLNTSELGGDAALAFNTKPDQLTGSFAVAQVS